MLPMPWMQAGLQGTMTGSGGAVNPAVNPEQDEATRMMLQLAQEFGQPGAAPSMASPLNQFLSLLSANAGAQLLQQPGAAAPAQRAVADEQAKPETFRLETQKRLEKSQVLRLDAMIRQADAAARKAEAEGKHAQALKLQKDMMEWEERKIGLEQTAELEQIAARARAESGHIGQRGAQDRLTNAQQAALRRTESDAKISGLAAKYGLTKEQVKELSDYRDTLEKTTADAFKAQQQYATKFDSEGGFKLAGDIEANIERKIQAMQQRDSAFGDVSTGTQPAAAPGVAKWKQYYKPKR